MFRFTVGLNVRHFFARGSIADICIAGLLIAATVVWSIMAGKDLNFDQLNYHFYLPYALFHDRLSHDFMAANGQSYLNPLAYVPFYWMVVHSWHSLLIAAVLATIHGLNIVVAYLITKTVLPSDYRHARALAVLGGVLAFLSPVFLTEVGTTFADISTCVLVLTALLLVLRSQTQDAIPLWKDRSLLAGVLLGIACALKLSNLIFGPACALSLLTMQPTLLRKLRSVAMLGLGSLAGGLAAHGYWGWQLWKAVGNPLFPYFGNYFPTDIYPKQAAMLERFLPTGVLDVLSLPFRMAQPRSWIYIESVSPDLRFAALILITILGGALLLFNRRFSNSATDAWAARRTASLCIFFFVAYGLWQWTSGNGRYGLVVSVICGPVLAVVTYAFFRKRAAGVFALCSLVVLQVVHLRSADLRWGNGGWTKTWYEVSVPERLRNDSFLYISVGNNSNSFIYSSLAADSAFTNPLGQIAFDLEGPGGKQLRSLLDQFKGRVRILASGPPAGRDETSISAWTATMDSHISRLGYAIDSSDCEMILAADVPPEVGQDLVATDRHTRRIRTCRLVERPFALAAERARITKIAENVVRWCPKLFKPAYTVMERTTDAWSAAYPSTDSMLIVKDGTLYGVFTRATANLVLGTVEAWERGWRPPCDSFPDVPRKTYSFE
jgi:hypothetical protein